MSIGVSIDFYTVLKDLRLWFKRKPVTVVADRFLRIFQDHGVAISQIPRLMPEASLAALQSQESLLPILTVDVLKKTVDLFGIRMEWLEGESDRIYDAHWCYKSPERFLNELSFLNENDIMPPVVAYTDGDFEGERRNGCHLVLVVTERCADLNDKQVLRYRVFMDHWLWGNNNSRIQVKAMIRIVEKKFDRPVPLYRITREDLKRLRAGQIVPSAIPECERLFDISLEDFSLSPEESMVSKESSEFPMVLHYIQSYGLDRYYLPGATLDSK